MSWSDDYFKLVEEERKKKKKKEEAPETFETSPYSAMGRLAANASTSQSKGDEKRSSAKQDAEEEEGLGDRLLNTAATMFPAVKVGKGIYDLVQGVRSGDLDFFQKGPFEDGFERSDIPKAIVGTAGDVAMEAAAGFGGALEGINDLILHGTAKIAEGNGYTNDAQRLREQAEVDVIGDVMLGEARDAMDHWSVLGRTSKSAAQGLGQIGLMLGTWGAGSAAGLGSTGVSLLTTGTTFASSAGSGINEAYLGGATDDEAWKYGLSVGAIDAGTELLFGGLGKTVNALGLSKGISSLDDIFAKKLSSQIANQTAKNMVEFGVKASAEGFEEVLAGIGTAISKKLTYMSDEELSQLVKDENLLEQFVVGSVISGLAQGGDVIDANRTGRDFVTDLTSNEQKVLDKAYQDRIAEAEKDNKKLTNREKTKIYDEVLKDLSKGYISTDVIEEVLGGEDYKAYKESLDSDNALREQQKAWQTEFDELGKKQSATLAEQARFDELRQQLKDIQAKIDDPTTNGRREFLKAQLSKNVYEMTKNDRLVESYFEQVRSKQKFEADLSKYEGKAKEVIKQVMDSGLADNTRATHEYWDLVANIAANRDISVSLANQAQIMEMVKKEHEAKGKTFDASKFEGEIIDGFISDNGIVLNAESKRARSFIIGHEITHSLEKAKHYEALQKALKTYAPGEYNSRFNARKAQYEGIYSSDYEAKIHKEVTGDMVGEFVFSDYDFVKHLATENPNVFQKIWNEIKYLAKIATAGSKEAMELEKVKREFERAWNETKAQKNTADGGVRYSIVGRDANGIEVYETSDDTKKLSYPERKKALLNSVLNEYRGRTVKFTKGDQTYYAFNDEVGVRKNLYGDSKSDKQGFKAKVNIGADGNYIELAENALYTGSSTETGKTTASGFHDDAKSWDYYVKTIKSDGHYFDVLINVKDTGNENYVYDITLKKAASLPSHNGLYDGNSAAYANNISQDGENVKYSLSDSDGKKLTKEQQEYFKDSKVRDENGNLKVMYHGSQDAGFHVFDPGMSDDGTSLFFVDRNDVAASYSGTTETYEAQTIRSAEDMNKFIESIGVDGYEVVEKDGQFILLYDGERVAASDTAPGIYKEFCWYEGVGEGDANYKVYLNLTNPLVVDAEGGNWDNVTREFSQEIADKYKTLTEEEKASLHDLAGWGDIREFRHELNKALDIVESRGGGDGYTRRLASAYQKLGEDINMYDLFSIAEDNFSDLAIEAWAVKQMNTRDYAAKAKAEGYDGVILKNIVDVGGYGGEYTPSTVAIAFDSNQVKSVANEMPTKDADIRYSLSPETDKSYMDAVSRGDTETAQKIVEDVAKEQGYTVRAYHGTARGDRVGNVFLPERATSGPMAFFTSDKTIAENYSKSKQDTSMAYDPDYDQYETQFRIKAGKLDIPLYRAWGYLPFDARRRITQKAGQLRENWDGDNELILDPDTNEANGGFQWQLKEARGNAIQALTEQWLNSGNLFNEEARFLDVLEMAGVTEEFKKVKGMGDLYFKDPNEKHEKVYDTFLKINNPFDTADVDEQFIADLEEWYEDQDQDQYVRENMQSDMWDKNGIDAYDFAERLRSDLEHNTTHAWTSIPDSVTDYLKSLGYDGIKDTGGKFGGDSHIVWIPFASEQIKSAEPVVYDDSGKAIPLSERFNPENKDIRYSLSEEGQTFKTGKGWNAPMSDMRYTPDIAPVSEEVNTKVNTDNTKVNTEVKNATRNASVEDLLPDNYAPTAEEEEAWEAERMDSLMSEDAPPEVDAPYYGESKPASVDDPFEDRDWYDIGNRKVKAYMYENPEVKPFFQMEAMNLLTELNDTTKGERWYNDQLYYESGGEAGFGGVKRHTSASIEELLDSWHMSYADIEKGLNAIIKDNGAENIAAAKKLEFMLNDRLLHGYKDFYSNGRVPPSQDYINLLNEKQITEYSTEAFDALMAEADRIAPVTEEVISKTEKTMDAPVAEKYEAIKPKPTKEPRMAKATPEEQAKTAKILFGEHQTPEQKSAWKWAKEHIFRHGAVFEDMALKTGNRELQARFDNIRRAESRAQTFIGKGKGNAKALVDVRKAVEKAGKTEAFNYYLYHLHNVDRMTLEERFKDVPNKSVFGYSVTAEVSRKAATNLETLNPEFKKWAEDLYAINKHLRQMMVSEGIISQETADLWQTMYPHYVPISRADYEGLNINVPLDTKRTGVNAPIKKAKGGNSDFYNVFDTMGSRIEQTYKAIAKNRFGVELKNTLGTAFESEKADIDSVLESMDTHEELLQEGKNGESPTFTVFENGERVKFAITKDMYEAMKPSQFTYTNKVLNKVGNVRRDILTTFSPTFALTNPIKDVQDILLNSQHSAKTYATIPEAIKSVITKDHWYQERMENGGDQDTYFDSQKKTFKKEKSKLSKIVGFPFEKIQQANEIIEQVPRMAEYIASRKMGRSIDVSMLDAARVTTNFGAAGDFTNMLNRNGFTFLGASVEGFNQQVRNVREAKAEGAKGWAKLAGKYLAVGLPALLLNHMLWDDDEEYEELSDYVKQNYYVIAKTEEGKFVRIPKGRAVAVIQDAFRQMENLITGNDEVDLEAFGQLVINNLAPNNPLENNIIAPVVQAWNNKTWYGDDLVPTRLQDLPAAEQFDETTDSLSKWLGEATNTSPYKWNYLLDQYSGGMGDILLPYLTPEADGGGLGAAFRDKFTTDPVLKNQNVSDFYDTMDKLTTNAKSSKATDEDILKYKYMNSVNSELGELYKQKRAIQNDMDLTDAEKYEAVREIQRQIVDITRESLNTYNKVKIQDGYARVGDRYYRLNDNGEWQKLTDKQIEKQEDVTDALGIDPSEYWENKSEYDFAYEYPEKYAVAKSVGGYESYKTYASELYDIKADKDENGKSITGSRKEKVIDYVNSLDIDYGMRLIIFKSEYNADDTYNYDIIDYLNSREDLSFEERVTILKELGFNVNGDKVTWD